MGILEDILSKLGSIEAALAGGGAPAKGGTTAKPASKSKVKESDITDLVKALAEKPDGRDKVKECFAVFGISRFGEAKPEQFQGIFDALKKIEEELDAGDSGTDDDDLLA